MIERPSTHVLGVHVRDRLRSSLSFWFSFSVIISIKISEIYTNRGGLGITERNGSYFDIIYNA